MIIWSGDDYSQRASINGVLKLYVSWTFDGGAMRYFYEVQDATGYEIKRDEGYTTMKDAQIGAIVEAKILLESALAMIAQEFAR